jgi:uncharacterized membrane protein YbhN (UPF0104 family)
VTPRLCYRRFQRSGRARQPLHCDDETQETGPCNLFGESMKSRRRVVKYLIFALKAGVTALALLYVVEAYGFQRILGIFTKVKPMWLGFASLLTLANIVQAAWRWQRLDDLLTGSRVPLWTLVIGYGRSQLYGLPLPSIIGADALRIAVLAQKKGFGAAARSVVCDRLLGLFATVLIVAVTLPLFAARIERGPLLASLVCVSFGFLAVFLLLVAMPSIARRIPFVGRSTVTVGSDLRATIALRGRGGIVFSQAFASQLLGVGVFAALTRGLGAPIPLIDCLLISLPATLAAAVPVSLGGWGVREAAIASMFSLIGADPTKGTAVSILFGLLYPLAGAAIEGIGLLTSVRNASAASD